MQGARPLPLRWPLFGALLGLVFARWLYGPQVLDPRATAWLLHGDPAQHYLGSLFFLREPWQWPPGLLTGFGDEPTSLVFTDAVPLLALAAKALGLPAGLQYLGLWMVACHALSGWFGVRLLHRVGVAWKPALLAGALFFVTAPVLLIRAYGHEALMGHFLVLAGLELALSPWRWGRWVLLVAVAALVHPYLAFMTGVLGLAACIAALRAGALAARTLAWQAPAALAILGVVTWTAGYYVGSGEVSAAGHGFFSANVLTWFQPMNWRGFMLGDPRLFEVAREWTRWMPHIPQATGGQYEGFAFLGAGALLALVLLAASFFVPRAPGPQPAVDSAIPRVRWQAVWLACGALALLAISARPSIGTWIVTEIPVGGALERMLGVFRASGRFIWPLTYLVLALAFAALARLRWPRMLVIALTVIQLADLSVKWPEFRGRFRNGPPNVEQPATAPVWSQVLGRCPRLEFVSGPNPKGAWSGPAVAAGLAGADFYPAPTARHSGAAAARRQVVVEQLMAGNGWRNDVVYLLVEPLPGRTVAEVAATLPAGLQHLRADGYDLVVPQACLAP